MLVRRHLESNHARLISANVDDHALNRWNDAVARKRIFPGTQLGMADARIDQVHLTDVALILLERGDLFRVGRPYENGTVAGRPARVVGRVAEVLDAVLGQLD